MKQVTIYQNVFKKDEPHYLNPIQAISRIRSGKSQQLVDEVRAGDKSKKTDLPIVLWSGIFTERKYESLHEHSSLIVLDFDHLDVAKTKPILASDDHVYACWISPSGDGLKALVKIKFYERHRDHFRGLETYFKKQYNLEVDPSGINESRACFESYDPDIVLNEGSKVFTAFITERASEAPQEVKQSIETDYNKIAILANMIRNAEEGEKHATLLKASRLAGGYIAAGRMIEETAIHVLFEEISKRDIDSEFHAKMTIRDGLEYGKSIPIREVIEEEDKITRQLKLLGGDMSFLSSDDSDFAWINNFAEGKIQLGLTTGSDYVDKHWRFKKNFTIINGHSNVGKTTFLLFLLVTSARLHGWKWLIYTSENRTASVKVKLMQFLMDEEVNRMSYEVRKIAFEWVNDHFIFINNDKVLSYFDLIVYCEKMRKQHHIDGFFIDPYNSLRVDLTSQAKGVHQYHYEAASEFLTYATSSQMALYLNTHAVTEAQRMKDRDGYPIPPYAEQTEGGGLFVNRSDDFLTVHRVIQHEDPAMRRTTQLHVRKVRETETGSQPTPIYEPLSFEMNSSRTFFRPSQGGSMFDPMDFSDIKQSQIPFDLTQGINLDTAF